MAIPKAHDEKLLDYTFDIRSTLDIFAPGGYAAIGQVDGVIPKTVNSYNPSVTPATDPADIWQVGGLYTGQPDPYTATTIDLVSSSPTDSGPNGIGAHAVQVSGLDENGDAQTEIFQLDGSNGVTSTSLWYRVTFATVVKDPASALPANINIGIIGISGGGFGFVAILEGEGVGSVAGFTVPAGKSIIISNYSVIGGNADSIGFLRAQLVGRVPDGVYQNLDYIEANVSMGQLVKNAVGVLLPEFADVLLRIYRCDVNTSFSGTISFLEIDNALVDPLTAQYVL